MQIIKKNSDEYQKHSMENKTTQEHDCRVAAFFHLIHVLIVNSSGVLFIIFLRRIHIIAAYLTHQCPLQDLLLTFPCHVWTGASQEYSGMGLHAQIVKGTSGAGNVSPLIYSELYVNTDCQLLMETTKSAHIHFVFDRNEGQFGVSDLSQQKN